MVLAASVWCCLAATASPTTFPPETDIGARIAWGQVGSDLVAQWQTFNNANQSSADRERYSIGAGLIAQVRRVEILAGVDLELPTTIVTFGIDVDARGGPVVGATIRDAYPQGAKPNEQESSISDKVTKLTVEGVEAFRRGNLFWAHLTDSLGPVLVVGNERGISRQIRWLQAPSHKKKARGLLRVAALQEGGPWLEMAFKRSDDDVHPWANSMPDGLIALSRCRSGSLALGSSDVKLTALCPEASHLDSLEHLIRAALFQTKAQVASLAADFHWQQAQHIPKKNQGKENDDAVWFKDWVDEFSIEASITKRPRGRLSATVDASDGRGLGWWWFNELNKKSAPIERPADMIAVEAEAALRALRQVELNYREVHGRFLPCGAAPAKVPQEPTPWVQTSCFRRLKFKPQGKIRMQLEATVTDGKLLLVARSDPDGDGSPAIWILNETDERPKQMTR